jgi:hypothetical protein
LRKHKVEELTEPNDLSETAAPARLSPTWHGRVCQLRVRAFGKTLGRFLLIYHGDDSSDAETCQRGVTIIRKEQYPAYVMTAGRCFDEGSYRSIDLEFKLYGPVDECDELAAWGRMPRLVNVLGMVVPAQPPKDIDVTRTVI